MTGPNGPPGAGSGWKVAPPSVVVTMAGQSREPQGTLPSTHQWVALTAVNDCGTNPDGTDGGTVTAGREGDGIAAGDLGAAGRTDSPQPASRPVASNVAEPIASTVRDRLVVPKRAPLRPAPAVAAWPGPLATGMASRPIRSAVRQTVFRMTS